MKRRWMPYRLGSEMPPKRPAKRAPVAVCRISLSRSRMDHRRTAAVAPKQAKFQAPMGPWMKSFPPVGELGAILASMRALSGQCRPSGTRNG